MAIEKTPSLASAELISVFAYLTEAPNAAIAIQVAEVDKTTAAIRELEEITRQVDTPYVGTYLS
jgi:hypothetical protein